MARREGFRKDIYRKAVDGYRAGDGDNTKDWTLVYKQAEVEVMRDLNLYEHYKNLYESVKPIRGRSVECKPIGQRRRDWETIEKHGDNYVCKLYNTDVVTYYADGSVGLKADTWSTPLTADFMHTHSPFYCYKKYNKLWARVHTTGEDMHYPIPENGELRLVNTGKTEDGMHLYTPSKPIVVQQRVIDRTKAKEAREKIKPFLDWGRMMLKLSDGWIMADTREQFCTKVETDHWRMKYQYDLPAGIIYNNYYSIGIVMSDMYKYLCECGEDKFMPAFLAILDQKGKAEETRIAKVCTHTWDNGSSQVNQFNVYDMKFSYEYFKRQVYAIADKSNDIHKTIEVEVEGKAITNVV